MILVTGGTGLLGSRLLYDLAGKGYRVRAIRRKSSRTGCFDFYFNNHPELLKNVEWLDADLNDIFSLEKALDGVEYVYHCAGKVSFQPSHRELVYRTNVEGTANLVNLCLEKKIRKLCHVSSVAALGRKGNELPQDESAVWKSSPDNSVYAISKYGAEREVWRGIAEGLDALIVNPAIILGPGNWRTDSSMIFSQVWRGLKFYTLGVAGFVDVGDVSSAMISLMEGNYKNERYILVSECLPFREVFDRIADDLGRKRPSIHAGPLLSEFAWRAEFLKSLFSRRKPVITKETARSARGKNFYSSEKIKNTLGIRFIPVLESLDSVSDVFLKSYAKK